MNSWRKYSDPEIQSVLAKIPSHVFQNERWFADRALDTQLHLVDSILARRESDAEVLSINLYQLGEESRYYYFIPFLIATAPSYFTKEHLYAADGYYLFDAIPTLEYISLMEQLVTKQAALSGGKGVFQFYAYPRFNEPRFHLHGSTSNSLLFISKQYLIKNYRRIYPGVNPELKIIEALTKVASATVPEIYGFFRYSNDHDYTLGIVEEQVESQGTGWEIWGNMLGLGHDTKHELLEQAYALGETLATLHQGLAETAVGENAFAEFTLTDFAERMRRLQLFLEQEIPELFGDKLHSIIMKISSLKEDLPAKLGTKFQIHGDLHLEQVVKTDEGWVILDFEGEPLKTIAERGVFNSPLTDLAAMLRSIDYRVNTESAFGCSPAAEIGQGMEQALISGYFQRYLENRGDFLPNGEREFKQLLIFFQIERAAYECLYEMKYRPDWLRIPLTGLINLIEKINFKEVAL